MVDFQLPQKFWFPEGGVFDFVAASVCSSIVGCVVKHVRPTKSKRMAGNSNGDNASTKSMFRS